jgi:hypothetical protein
MTFQFQISRGARLAHFDRHGRQRLEQAVNEGAAPKV